MKFWQFKSFVDPLMDVKNDGVLVPVQMDLFNIPMSWMSIFWLHHHYHHHHCPAGLFFALQLAKLRDDYEIIFLLQCGQSVEKRGKDIGSLIHRKVMNEDNNFAFGEGGAGTWSDGKLTTKSRMKELMFHKLWFIWSSYWTKIVTRKREKLIDGFHF